MSSRNSLSGPEKRVTAGFLVDGQFESVDFVAFVLDARKRCRDRACRRARACRGPHRRCAYLFDAAEILDAIIRFDESDDDLDP